MKQMITKDDWLNYLKTIQSEPEDQKILKMLQYASQNYEQLSTDVKDIVDNVFELLTQKMGQSIDALPESKEKRQYQRLHARIKERHWHIEQFLQAFDKPPTLNISILLNGRKFFIKHLQSILDFMFDISKKTHKGESEFAQLGLTYLCVNEFICAFHLIEHHYVTQAYTHIRTIYEILDKIELFYKEPKWAELWASDDEKRKIKELSPSAVRKKLGNPKHDPIYDLFSSLGPHGTFRSVQTTSGMRTEPSEKGNPRITLWIGGTQFEHHFIWATMSISHTLMLLLSEIIKIYEKDLNIDESKEVMNSAIKDYKELHINYFIPWAKENNLDSSEMEDLLNKEQLWNFRQSEDIIPI